jgi:hypothetical protein
MKDQTIHFRTTKNFAEAIKKMAECEGLTVSEFIHFALEEKRRNYNSVELFAIDPESNKKPESIGVYLFKGGYAEGAEALLQIAKKKMGPSARLATDIGLVEQIPFSDTLSLE